MHVFLLLENYILFCLPNWPFYTLYASLLQITREKKSFECQLKLTTSLLSNRMNKWWKSWSNMKFLVIVYIWCETWVHLVRCPPNYSNCSVDLRREEPTRRAWKNQEHIQKCSPFVNVLADKMEVHAVDRLEGDS